MAMAPLYDLKQVILSIGGQRLTGFGETGAVEVEAKSAIMDDKVSADGRPVYSRNNDPRVDLTITVGEGSTAARILGEICATQEALFILTPLPVILVDLLNGDSISDEFCIFLERPGISKAKAAGERVWKVQLPNGVRRMLHATTVLV